MPTRKSGSFFVLIILLAVAVLAAVGAVWSGLYNVGADVPHTRPVYSLLNTVRERSIEVRAASLQVPELSDPARAVQGAGNYRAMCAGCHLAPGMTATELSQGLYPAPPDLTKAAADPAEAFWTIKHGIKASGMPAWGKSMQDEYIWNIVAFLQRLPKLSPDEYRALVAQSGGHSHGGGESMPEPAETQAEPADHSHGDDAHDAHPHTDNAPHPHTGEEADAAPAPKKDHADDGHVH